MSRMLASPDACLKAQLPLSDWKGGQRRHSHRMPLFDFTCAACGKVSEVLVRSAEDKPACPHCASPRMERQLPTFSAQAKGKEHVHSTGCGCGKPRGGCGAN
jgi:putative FmdB family regulatory protein